MGGGLMQLVAYGAQDIYLTGNPQITFFKVVYRRHTNFAMEAIVQNFEGKFDFGRKCSVTISRNGDLVHRVYVEVELSGDENNKFGVTNAFALIDEVELEIGGQLIDRHFGDWMNIWTELTHGDSKGVQLKKLVNQDVSGVTAATPLPKTKLYIPLQFSFCRNPGLAIPLIALQYHEVKLHFRVASLTSLDETGAPKISGCCYCDYIYLDTDERRRFAQTSHEYLIEQVQSNRGNKYDPACLVKHELNFNHPVKELVWVHVDTANGHKFQFVDNQSGTAAGGDLGNDDAVLKLNGHDRFSKRPGDYFKNVQRYQHHSGAKKIMGDGTTPIYCYSFALQPEEHQPSGTCNFSRIDNALLELNGSSADADCTDIYAVSYNVLRVMSGMGGLAYSN